MARPFAWSFSALKSYETCPKKHWHTRVKKDVIEPVHTSASYGEDVHGALDRRLKRNEKLPLGMRHLEQYAAQIEEAPGTLYTEQKLAINADFAPTGYFDSDVWLRGQLDVTKVAEAQHFAVVFDYKTGKLRDDYDQLAIMAALLLAHEPDVDTVAAAFIWLKHKTITSRLYQREKLPELWNLLMPRVKQFELAWKTDDWPAKQNGLCKKYCPVKSCIYNG